MTDPLSDYVSAKDAATEIGIPYNLLIKRIHRNKIKSDKIGYAIVIHKDEVKRAKQEEQKNAVSKNMEKPTR